MALYRGLVAQGVLQPASSQEECVATLQSLWEALRRHGGLLAEWRVEHDAWARAHAAWREDAVGWEGTADSMWEEAVNAAHDLQREDFAPDSLLEPREPRRPVLDLVGCCIEGSGHGLMVDLLMESLGEAAQRMSHQRVLQRIRRSWRSGQADAGQDEVVKRTVQEIACTTRLLVLEDLRVSDDPDRELTKMLLAELFAEGVAVVMTPGLSRSEDPAAGIDRPLLSFLHSRGAAVHRVDEDQHAVESTSRAYGVADAHVRERE